MNTSKNLIYHLLALLTAIIWGTTFVSTKVLINYGLTPAEILLYRFVLAYIGIWFICPRRLWADNVKDELLFVACGLTGGSLYFITENMALGITLASNVSLIICTSPILTALLVRLLGISKSVRKTLVYGSVFALIGVALVVFNGSMILQLNPLGDILTLTSALMWSLYSIILKWLDKRYSVLFITRKVFIYGILTLLPVFFFSPLTRDTSILLNPVVVANLLFLGVIASMLCYIFWNLSVKELGAVRASNYIYIIPLVTLITSSIVIDESITPIAIAGCILILFGVYVAERGFSLKPQKVNV